MLSAPRSFLPAVRLTLLACAIACCLASCSDAPNTQYLPIGQRCSEADECGTSPFACNSAYPGGYCERGCTTDGDCPLDAVCSGVVRECRRKCDSVAQCRAAEGYVCRPAGASSPFCDLPAGS